MSCCGKSRTQLFIATGTTAKSTPAAVQRQSVMARASAAAPAGPPAATTTFQYTGKTRLTVIGPVSRRRYDFDRSGVRISVDARDANSLATVPTLKRV